MDVKDFLEKNEQWHMWIVLILAAVVSFWRLGDHSVSEWDEARYGEIAYWMNESGDYINYQYAGAPDSWNAKPPLAVWLVAGSYRVFGYNEWGLRIPSAIATIGFFLFFFLFVRIYQSATFALTSCLILIACKGIVGHHVGRTGDTDAFLVLFLMAFLYTMALYLEQNRPGAIILAGVWLGLAFYAKGTPFVFYLPGVFLYLLFRKKMLPLIRNYHAWISLGVLMTIIGSWYIGVTQFGQSFENETHLGKNSWEVLIFYDTFHRFTTPGVEGHPGAGTDYGFFFSALDIKFNLWNYLFYAGIMLGGILGWRNKASISQWMGKKIFRLLLLSALILATLGLVLTISQSKLVWYIAPVLPFAAIWTTWFMQKTIKWQPVLLYVWIGLWVFCMGRQMLDLHQIKEDQGQFLRKHRMEMQQADNLLIYKAFPQDVRLYADWYNRSVSYATDWDKLTFTLQPQDVLIAKLTEKEKQEVHAWADVETDSFGDLYIIRKTDRKPGNKPD